MPFDREKEKALREQYDLIKDSFNAFWIRKNYTSAHKCSYEMHKVLIELKKMEQEYQKEKRQIIREVRSVNYESAFKNYLKDIGFKKIKD